MKRREPSATVESEDTFRITRRVELRFSLGQALPKCEELSDLVPKRVEVFNCDLREPVSRIDLDLAGRPANVAAAVRVLEKHFGAEVMRDEVLPPPGAPDDRP